MQVEQGILNPFTLRAVGQGVTGAHFAAVSIGGLSQRCVVKPAGPKEIAAECFCALIGDFLGMPTLAPVVVTDPRDQSLWFGARDAGYPSLSSRLNITNPPTQAQLIALSMVLSTWVQAPAAISFDELIANGDRNPGNILWNGVVFTMIDHERSLEIQPMTLNKLALFMLQNMGATQIAQLQQGIVGASITQQAMLGQGTSVWAEIQAEFAPLPAAISEHLSAFQQLCQSRAHSLISSASNALMPLLTQQGGA